MKIVHILNTGMGNYGGKEKVTLDLMAELRDQGIDAYLVCLRPGRTVKEAKDREIPVTIMEPDKALDFKFVDILAQYFQEEEFELVHTHDFRENFYGRLAAKKAQVPVITTLHALAKDCLSLPWRKRWSYHMADLRTYKHTTAFIAISQEGFDFLVRRVGRKNVTLIRNAIDIAAYSGQDHTQKTGSPFKVCAVGRLDEQKGFRHLIEAARMLAERDFNIEFHLAGQGKLEDALSSMISQYRLGNRFFLHGFVNDMPAFFADKNAFALPSLTEVMPMALLEAMAAALPIVATRVGGIPELLEHDKSALLIPPASPASLGDSFIRLMEEPKLCQSLGENALTTVRDYASIQTMGKEVVTLYEKVLSGR